MQTFRQVFVIQCASTGLFLTEELGYSRSLRHAGKCYSMEEAVDTAVCNLSDDFEVFGFWERALEGERKK